MHWKRIGHIADVDREPGQAAPTAEIEAGKIPAGRGMPTLRKLLKINPDALQVFMAGMLKIVLIDSTSPNYRHTRNPTFTKQNNRLS
ncbi:hypothetical protein VT99_13242 [Candidatus Electrothrix marina]|uniref:Uncharacterized protein n=1 Tax=Candidatus Electrothrix marina TaxID=1859130 RepID=A0A3S3QD84_9BACT|nr:hypothetical protein VT99_13242 [Candidatus Electrothrix marina]